MRKLFFILLAVLISCQTRTSEKIPPGKWLEYYRTQTNRTDPGEYRYLYENLPASLDSISNLIRVQLIHPYEALLMGIEVENYSQDASFPDVESMLKQLVKKDSTGLSYARKEEDRLIVASYHHAILLASILRDQGIAVRLRSGFSRYFEDNYRVRFNHTVCEVWNAEKMRWMLVVPELDEIDLKKRKFDYSWEAWRNIRDRKMDPRRYTAPFADGLKAVINALVLDAALILQDEKLYWDLPVIVLEDINKLSDLSPKQVTALSQLATRIAEYHSNPNRIGDIYYNREYFQSAHITYKRYMDLVLLNQ